MLAGLDPEEDDEAAAPGQTEEEIFEGLQAEIFGGLPGLDDENSIW